MLCHNSIRIACFVFWLPAFIQASENIMANFTQSLSITPSPPLSLETRASAVTESTSQTDFLSSSSFTYLSQDVSSSIIPQTIVSSLLRSILLTSTESASLRPSVSSHSNNISAGVSLTASRDLSLTPRASAITKLSSQEECQLCDRNAHCVGGHCICKHGFMGDGLDCWVETRQDQDWACLVLPCKNGGTCKPGSSKCICPLGYVGDYCESHCPPSVHISFDGMDDYGRANSAYLANGAQIAPHAGKCGNAVSLLGGDVFLDGAHLKRIPREGITISTWVKLDTTNGVQSIFDTVGSHSKHEDGQYHFEIENGKVRWIHRNENRDTIFSLLTQPAIREGQWTQITATYSARKERARVFVDGDMREEVKGQGLLSLDWGGKAGIGKHEHLFGSRLLRGMIDEFYIFPCELSRLDILVLMRHCRVYFDTKR